MAYLHKINFNPQNLPSSTPEAAPVHFGDLDALLRGVPSNTNDFSRAVKNGNAARLIGVSGAHYEMDVTVAGDAHMPVVNFALRNSDTDEVERTFEMSVVELYESSLGEYEAWCKDQAGQGRDIRFDILENPEEAIAMDLEDFESDARITFLQQNVFGETIQGNPDFWRDFEADLKGVLMAADGPREDFMPDVPLFPDKTPEM